MPYREEPSDLDRNIHDYQTRMQSLGFNAWKDSFGTGSELSSKKITNPNHALEFLNYKITEQNEEYSQQASQKARSPYQTPSDLFSHKEENKTIQIKSLLKQAEHNNKEGSFKARNASAYQIAISKSGKVISGIARVLSSSSMSSGGDHPQQKKSSLQRSQSLPPPKTNGVFQQEKLGMEKQSMPNQRSLKKPDPGNRLRNNAIRKKTLGKRISDTWSIFTSKKTNQQNASKKFPKLVNPYREAPKLNRNTSLFSANSSFVPSRVGSSSSRALTSQDSTRGGDNRRPGPAPGRPLNARQAISRGVGAPPSNRY
jgi:hypothetical protein